MTIEHFLLTLKTNPEHPFSYQTTYPAMTNDPSLYHRFFTPAERRRLRAAPADDPSSEINLIRILVLRLLQACSDAPSADLDTQAGILSTFSQAGLTITALVRLRARLDRQELEDLRAGRKDPDAPKPAWPTFL